MDITKDIRPLTEFKRDTGRFMSHLKETGRPSILTVNGKPSLVVMDAQAWQDIQDQIEYAGTVTAIRRGLAQARDGQGTDARAFFNQLDAEIK
ncbi:MAG: type II toxin-antitoxin system Phd/YefM family antitoxin [Rhodospirillales bacterium]|jgi:prevent-host-death family protein|nr:type II toxin-antitoxin system Phd/YefM family antitoxin [Rhodospirillales bacterium]